MTPGYADSDTLSDALKILADPNRIDLLNQLREPKIIDEIDLTPSRINEGTNPDRPLTRQAIRHHIRRLRDENLIQVSRRRRPDGREVSEFQVNGEAFYELVQELEMMNEWICGGNFSRSELQKEAKEAEEGWRPGPKLVLVRGLHSGRVFPLNKQTQDPPRGWVIGRDPEASIPLDYDASIALENAEIVRRDGDFRIIDLRSSKQRTVLNGTELHFGGEAELEHGDIIEIGSSILVFRGM